MFDFNREVPSSLQALYCLLFYVGYFILTYNNYYRPLALYGTHRIKLYWVVVLLPVVFSVTYFSDSDFFHYYERLQLFKYDSGDRYMEGVYAIFAFISGYQYLLFRFLIWGLAVLVVYNTARMISLKADVVLYFLFVVYILLFAYARASLAMAILFYGYVLFSISRHRGSRITGIIIMCLSVYFHSSMVIALLLCLFNQLLRWKKTTIILVVCACPLLVIMIRVIFDYVLGATGLDGMVFAKMAIYAGAENMNAPRSLIGEIHKQMEILSFILPLFFIAYEVYFKKDRDKSVAKRYRTELKLFQVSVLICIISIAFYFVGFDIEVFAYRIRFMAMIPVCLSFVSLSSKKIIKCRQYQFCLLWGFLTCFMSLFSAWNHA